MADEVKLFRTWSSPFALRIVWALKLKGVEFETILEDLANKSSLLLENNPVHKKVPVLVHNGRSVCESFVILEYIDETWTNGHPLFSKDPYEKAEARFWAKFGDEMLWLSVRGILLGNEAEQEEAKVQASEHLKYLEEQLGGNKYFGGEAIGFLDLAVGWMANLVSVLEEITGHGLIEELNFPLLWKWMQDFSDAPVIKESWPPRDKLVVKFRTMRDLYLAGKI
ncbi:Glutathione transferase [Heracleum sosnowskyi]|uniref:Probable glutathione S-transferase n=1 Tax=Heracleum sosnowskyi TaxID=360622 RepID=A0AAD8IZQ0_9APIA|nr:Glutathione transferase [Heracleum sosnowskyi]